MATAGHQNSDFFRPGNAVLLEDSELVVTALGLDCVFFDKDRKDFAYTHSVLLVRKGAYSRTEYPKDRHCLWETYTPVEGGIAVHGDQVRMVGRNEWSNMRGAITNVWPSCEYRRFRDAEMRTAKEI